MNRNTLQHPDTRRVSWLAEQLGTQRTTLAGFLRSLSSLGVPGNMKPSRFRKFILLLNQVATEKEKATALISEIEAIEQQHRFAKKQHRLRHTSDIKPQPAPQPFEAKREAERPFMELFELWVFWRFFLNRNFSQK